jgi:hypothetical protein
MRILKSDLDSASEKEILTPDQANKLWDYFGSLRIDQPKFKPLHIIYYFGGLLVLSSMSWFLNNAWNDGAMIMFICTIFAGFYLAIGNNLWTKPNLKIPGGLLITAAVGLTPVFIYGLEKTLGLLPDQTNYHNYHHLIRGHWIAMELGTIIVALIALRFYKFPFITFPLAISLWYISMDFAPVFFDKETLSFQERGLVSCVFGLVVLFCSYFVDRKFKETDFAFWTYLFGMVAFWIGLSLVNSNSEISKFIYFLLNILFIILSVYLHRKIFAIFGVFGVLSYISHLSWSVFKDSQIFPLIIAMLGILIIFLGVKFQKNKEKVEKTIESWFPTFLNKWRPAERI